MTLKIHRIYEFTEPQDEIRILVDKLWPRGISREEARLDDWWKDVAPSTKLRKWFRHESSKWEEFREKYLEELRNQKDEIALKLSALDLSKPLVLLYGARNKERNQAVVLKEFLEKEFTRELNTPKSS